MMKAVVTVALVLGALGYGGRQAIASAQVRDCQYAPPLWLGSCTSTPECDQRCYETNGDLWVGLCNAGCCACYM
jgi:hypothetical protein